jgi:hypothetical protein
LGDRGDEMSSVAILAFGSLIDCPGREISPHIIKRISTRTPFPIEFARYSGETRGGAPTLAPVRSGGRRVNAKLLVLDQKLSITDATDMLWRRETGNIGTGRKYPANRGPRAVRVRTKRNFGGIDTVLYTDFYARGKVRRHPRTLALRAINSVQSAPTGKDGITYLINAKKAGIITPLMKPYEQEILRKVGATSLKKALKKLTGTEPEQAL